MVAMGFDIHELRVPDVVHLGDCAEDNAENQKRCYYEVALAQKAAHHAHQEDEQTRRGQVHETALVVFLIAALDERLGPRKALIAVGLVPGVDPDHDHPNHEDRD